MGNRLLSLTIAMLVSSMATRATGQSTSTEQAQIEKGRQVVAQVCTTCHTTLGRMLQVHKQTTEQWKDTVYFMISRGAQVMPDEIEAVAGFLAATSGRGGPAGRRSNPQTDAQGEKGLGK